jgi:hypothetical protein
MTGGEKQQLGAKLQHPEKTCGTKNNHYSTLKSYCNNKKPFTQEYSRSLGKAILKYCES